jgi:hypothetical protein
LKLNIGRFVQATSITGAALFVMAATASATQIAYNTNTAGTEFTYSSGGTISDGGLELSDSTGDAATLIYEANVGSISGTPSNIDFGNFVLACAACTTDSGGTFGAFTFAIIVDDTTNGATGEFIGTSTGGSFTSNTSTITIDWSTLAQPPTQLGPDTFNELTGNFGPTYFTINASTPIVAPNSGIVEGESTVQGSVNSTPEPPTLGLIGASLLGLGLIRRRSFAR